MSASVRQARGRRRAVDPAGVAAGNVAVTGDSIKRCDVLGGSPDKKSLAFISAMNFANVGIRLSISDEAGRLRGLPAVSTKDPLLGCQWGETKGASAVS